MPCWWHEIMAFWDFSYKDCIYRPVGSPFLCYKRILDTIATSWMLWEDQINNVGDLCCHTVVLLSAPTHTSPSLPLIFGWPPATGASSCLCIIILWLLSEHCEHRHPLFISKTLSKPTTSLCSEWLEHNVLKEVSGGQEMGSDIRDRLFPQLSLR